MFATFGRLVGEVSAVARLCGAGTGLRYAGACLARARSMIGARNLQPADARMRSHVSLRLRGATIEVPCGEMDRVNGLAGDSPCFSAIREIFGREVYLRGFRSTPKAETMLDLGANRGMVTLMAAKILGARRIVGVEPLGEYDACFEVLANANGLTQDQRRRFTGLATDRDGDGTVTVGGLCAAHGIDRIDFIKIDIEGGENAVVLGDGGFLERTECLVLELHPHMGSRNAEIVARIGAAGLRVAVADGLGGPAGVAEAVYLFAARDPGMLAVPAL